MRYEGNIYRPPSEASSLIVQATIGCAHNKCTFCSMYKDKHFRARPVDEVIEDLREARRMYRRIGRVFLADGDALVLSSEKLLRIIGEIRVLMPEKCSEVKAFAIDGEGCGYRIEKIKNSLYASADVGRITKPLLVEIYYN